MAHITLNNTSPLIKSLLQANAQIIMAQQTLARIKSVADQITSGGVNTSLLETDQYAMVPTGWGQTVYTDIANLLATLNSLSPTLSALDQG